MKDVYKISFLMLLKVKTHFEQIIKVFTFLKCTYLSAIMSIQTFLVK